MARQRRGWAKLDATRLAALEQALRGQDPNLPAHYAAEALATSRSGTQLLCRIIQSSETAELREAAVYGFSCGTLRSSQKSLLLRVFKDPLEAPRVRGQAAEALGPNLHWTSPRRRQQRRYIRAVQAFVRGLDDPAPEVRFWSIYALAHPENTWLLPKLEAMAANDAGVVPGMWTVRQEALWAITWILKQDLDCDPRTL